MLNILKILGKVVNGWFAWGVSYALATAGSGLAQDAQDAEECRCEEDALDERIGQEAHGEHSHSI